jgi:hypothetical protein
MKKDDHDKKIVLWNRILMLASFFLLFSSVIAGILVMVIHLTIQGNKKPKKR